MRQIMLETLKLQEGLPDTYGKYLFKFNDGSIESGNYDHKTGEFEASISTVGDDGDLCQRSVDSVVGFLISEPAKAEQNIEDELIIFLQATSMKVLSERIARLTKESFKQLEADMMKHVFDRTAGNFYPEYIKKEVDKMRQSFRQGQKSNQ